jgi:hypothetical protein
MHIAARVRTVDKAIYGRLKACRRPAMANTGMRANLATGHSGSAKGWVGRYKFLLYRCDVQPNGKSPRELAFSGAFS